MYKEQWVGSASKRFLNTILNLETKEIGDFIPDIFCVSKILYQYDPDKVDKPHFDAFLKRLCAGHEDRIKFMRSHMYTVVFSKTEYQVLFYFQGPGGSGKSTFIQLLVYLVGPGVTKTTTFKSLSSERFGIFNLISMKLILINDARELIKNLDTVKAFVGEDSLEGREAFKTSTKEVYAEGIIVATSNYPLQSNDQGSAILRRIRDFPFEDPIENQNQRVLIKRDPNGEWSGPFTEEMSAILNWILNTTEDDLSFLKDFRNKVTSLKDHQAETMANLNPMISWVKECVEVHPGLTPLGKNNVNRKTGEISLDKGYLYPCYLKWCKLTGKKGICGVNQFKIKFLSACKTLNIQTRTIHRNYGLVFENVRVKPGFNTMDYELGSDIVEQAEFNEIS